MKIDPWSDSILIGSPTNVKNLMRALVIVWALIFLRGTASGNRVAAHIIDSKQLFPDLLFRTGPTQSTSTLLNGSSTAGIGFNGAIGGFWLGFPTT